MVVVFLMLVEHSGANISEAILLLFVLELVIDSLKDNPQDISDLMKEIGRVWEVCVENGQRPRYEKLRPEQKQRLKNVALVPGHNFMPPPYPSQKQV